MLAFLTDAFSSFPPPRSTLSVRDMQWLTTITRVLRSGITSKTLHQEIFDEVEIFVAIRRHGFSFMVADTVRSSEQAKYPLTAVAELSDTFGDGLAGSYDGGSWGSKTSRGANAYSSYNDRQRLRTGPKMIKFLGSNF
ncbi:hypothetical protein EDD15DRAFT_2204771 [Pisolithus albus]|nr:hypothetical protein EDD15DRAFT_2204771 [Pisolithus albus]